MIYLEIKPNGAHVYIQVYNFFIVCQVTLIILYVYVKIFYFQLNKEYTGYFRNKEVALGA